MFTAFWDTKPWFRAGSGAGAMTAANFVLAGVRNLAGSGLILRVASCHLLNNKAAGYAGTILRILTTKYPDASNGTQALLKPYDSNDSVPATTLVDGVKATVTFGTAIAGYTEICIDTASMEQAAAVASAPHYARNLFESWAPEGIIVRPGEMLVTYALAQENNCSLAAWYGFQIADEEPTEMSEQMDTLNGHLENLVTSSEESVDALKDLRLNERSTVIVDRFGNTFQYQQFGI